jgi:hypothetical protein
MKALANIVLGFASIVIIVVAAPLLVLAGRLPRVRGELVVDEELLVDDPGVDDEAA